MTDTYFKSFDDVPVGNLEVHPRNAQYYGPMDETTWELFLSDIEENGITTPVKYNTKTGYVIAGNQRLEAARALAFDTIPAIGVYLETVEEEIVELIRDNDIRRRDTVGSKLQRVTTFNELVQKLREQGKIDPGTKTKDYVKKSTGVSNDMYNMSIQFQRLSPQERQTVLEYAKHENPTEKELREKIKTVSDSYSKLEKTHNTQSEQYNKLRRKVRDRYGMDFDPTTGSLFRVDSEGNKIEDEAEDGEDGEDGDENSPDLSEVSEEEIANLWEQYESAKLELRMAVSDRDTAKKQRDRTFDALGVIKRLDAKCQAMRQDLVPMNWDEELRKECYEQSKALIGEIDRIREEMVQKMWPGGSDD